MLELRHLRVLLAELRLELADGGSERYELLFLGTGLGFSLCVQLGVVCSPKRCRRLIQFREERRRRGLHLRRCHVYIFSFDSRRSSTSSLWLWDV